MANKKVMTDLPHNSDAERACLGYAILRKDALYSVLSSLEENDFYEGRHQIIYAALKRLESRHIKVDTVTLTEELINIKELENIGGVEYLKACIDTTVAVSSLEFHIGIVSAQATLRKMLICIRGIDEKYKTQEITNVDDFITNAEMDFKDSIAKRRISGFQNIDAIANKVQLEISSVTKSSDDENACIGLSSGYKKIDFFTQGFKKGEMIIVAARPSVGKTALSLNFAYKAATISKTPVAIFSLEMNAESLVRRLIASESFINLKKVNSGSLSPTERSTVASAIKKVGNAPIFIDDSSGIKLMDIIAKSRKLKATNPDLGLIIIDYLGLVQLGGNAKSQDSRNEEVRKISLQLKGLAKDLNIPIIVVSQLSRMVEQRGENKRPMLSDLRDSGSIEQDADIVMLLYREDYYDKFKKPDEVGTKKLNELSPSERSQLTKEQKAKALTEQIPGSASYVEVNIAKNRNGQVGRAGLFFYKDYGRFDEPTPEWEEEKRKIDFGED